MDTPPLLFDRPALARHRTRAAQAPALFLHHAAADDVQERLTEINRSFTAPAVVTPWPEIWRDRMPGAVIVPDDDTLALVPAAHDLVVHALCLHWANDPVGQLVQCRHALRPDGLVIAVLFGGQTLQELRRCLAQAEAETAGGLSPRVAPTGDIRDLGALMQRAGLTLSVADGDRTTVRYDSALHLMRDLRAMGETNALSGRLRRPTRRAVMLRATALYAESFAGQDGRIAATFDIVTLTGWAPSVNQPQPLRPGSATHRLADALGAAERSLQGDGD